MKQSLKLLQSNEHKNEVSMSVTITNPKELGIFTELETSLIKDMFFKGHGSDLDFNVFLHVCKHTNLDPFLKQIYPVFRNSKQADGTRKSTMTIQTGIDGYRLMADRSGKYAPGKETTFCYDKNNKLLSATAFVKKLTRDGTWHEVSATAFWSEYVQMDIYKGIPTKFWSSMPHNMLAKCAEALAIRKACPAEVHGVYTKEEMDQADVEVFASPSQPLKTEEIAKLESIVEKKEEKIERITEVQVEELRLLKITATEEASKNIDNVLKMRSLSGLKELPVNGYKYIKDILEKNQKMSALAGIEVAPAPKLAWEVSVND